jgi:two-component system sensor histidine kinase BaeS
MRLAPGRTLFFAVLLSSWVLLVLLLALNWTLTHDRTLLREQFQWLWLQALLCLVLSALTATLLTRHLRGPLRPLEHSLRRLASGHFQTRLPLKDDDLAAAFNQLAATLEQSEQSRKQWIADVSHELRTPLAVLRAELEALQDGIRPLDAQALERLHTQVMGLNRLTDDLFQLARSDLGQMHYKMQEVNLFQLLQECSEAFRPRFEKAGLELELMSHSSRLKTTVWGDADRLRQLINNLLENSQRYTSTPGRLQISCVEQGGQWLVRFDDSAPGVPPEIRERLFERFFRVEASRSKKLGGSGLGLALCRNIVEAHQGELTAQPSPLGGLRIEWRLPCHPR